MDRAFDLYKQAESLFDEVHDKQGLAGSFGSQAVILIMRGDLDGGMALLKKQEKLSRDLKDDQGLQASLGNQALVRQARNDLHGAMGLRQEEERICRELGHDRGLAISLANQANIHAFGFHQFDIARRKLDEARATAWRCGYADLVAQIDAMQHAIFPGG